MEHPPPTDPSFEPQSEDERLDPPRTLPRRLWEQLRADPARAPEHLALAASTAHGPAAAAWAQEIRGRYAYPPDDLALMAKRRHASLSRWAGAAGGIGGVWTMLPDIAALAWLQSRMVFFIAAAYGYDPQDPMRPAEFLVMRDFYPDPVSARAALDGLGATVAEQYVGSKLTGDEALLPRLTKLAMRKGASKLAGKAIPGFAIAFNAVTNERETRALAKDAMRFYGG
ncbi:MAG: EcsC family protein [Solirubrobacteraceae bacterium]